MRPLDQKYWSILTKGETRDVGAGVGEVSGRASARCRGERRRGVGAGVGESPRTRDSAQPENVVDVVDLEGARLTMDGRASRLARERRANYAISLYL
jgi:hypothetical protein